MAPRGVPRLIRPSPDGTGYRPLGAAGVRAVGPHGRAFRRVAPEAVAPLTGAAIADVPPRVRASRRAGRRATLDDPEGAADDRTAALARPKTVAIVAARRFPAIGVIDDTGGDVYAGWLPG